VTFGTYRYRYIYLYRYIYRNTHSLSARGVLKMHPYGERFEQKAIRAAA
jgi:hypothetical protein